MNETGWGVGKRLGFRFGIVLGVLILFPFPIFLIPNTTSLVEALNEPFQWGAVWFGHSVLGISDLPVTANGSGDHALDYVGNLFAVVLAALGATVWSLVDRRRAYPRLAVGAWVVLRHYACWAMLVYGFAKIFKSQFPDLQPSRLSQRVGDVSPMRLLWNFMGYSTPYTVFGGLAEAIGGALLLWRRTALIGAVMMIAVMTNVVLLNYSYDVPVKLVSMQYLIMAAAIAAPGARRLLRAAMGHAVGEVPPRVRSSRRRERARRVAKLAMIGLIAGSLYTNNAGSHPNDRIHELYGNWSVDSFVADGIEHPPLATDPLRWQLLSANPRSVALWLSSGDREPPVTVNRGVYTWKVDAASHTMTLTLDDAGTQKETWRYTRPAPDRLVIDAVHGGRYLHVTLHLEPEPQLLTRGFHWINEEPFNR